MPTLAVGMKQPTLVFVMPTASVGMAPSVMELMYRAGLLLAVSIGALAAAALVVRLPALDARPMHCDEAVQAVKAGQLLETGEYRYDPYEFHGPTLNYFTLPALWLGGERTFAESTEAAYRIVPVIFGAALVLLLLLVTDGLGRAAAVIAGVLTAISPAMVFYSRYYIHEMLLVFFTFAAIGCGWRYLRSGRIGWAIATGAAVGLMHATKETWVLAAAAMVAGVLGCFVWTQFLVWLGRQLPDSLGRQLHCRPGGDSTTVAPTCDSVRRQLPDSLGRQLPDSLGRQLYCRPMTIVAAVAAACVVAVVLYSSFFTYGRGPLDSILTYETYLNRGGGGDHNHPWDFYFRLFVARVPARGFYWPDALIPGLAVIGFVASLLPTRAHESTAAAHLLPRFLAFYTLALTLAYTIIPYKTPWCMLGFLHGMIVLAGVGAWAVLRCSWLVWLVGRVADLLERRQVGNLPYGRLCWLPVWAFRVIAGLLLAAGIVHLGRQCYAINLRFPADQANPYVYVHTTSDTVRLAEQVERLASVADEGHELTIHVVTPDNPWPLPWYLRAFPRVGYWSDAAAWWDETQGRPQASVLLLAPDLPEHIDDYLAAHYLPQGIRSLRPGVFVNIYITPALWENLAAAAEREQK